MYVHKQEEHLLHQNSDAALYDRFASAIFAYVRLHTLSREDAEDLTVEVFMAALERNNLAGMPEKEQLTWLRRVAHNKFVDQYRRTARQAAPITLEMVEETMYGDERLSPEYSAAYTEDTAPV